MMGVLMFRDILLPSQNIPEKSQNGTERTRNFPCFSTCRRGRSPFFGPFPFPLKGKETRKKRKDCTAPHTSGEACG